MYINTYVQDDENSDCASTMGHYFCKYKELMNVNIHILVVRGCGVYNQLMRCVN